MLELSHGNTYHITYRVKNLDGTNKNLTGTQKLVYKMARRVDSEPLIEFVLGVDDEISIIDEEEGLVLLKLVNPILNTLREGTHYHEFWHINALGDPNTLMENKVFIKQQLIKE